MSVITPSYLDVLHTTITFLLNHNYHSEPRSESELASAAMKLSGAAWARSSNIFTELFNRLAEGGILIRTPFICFQDFRTITCFVFTLTLRGFSRCFYPKRLTTIRSHIHTPMAVSIMQGDSQLVRSSKSEVSCSGTPRH